MENEENVRADVNNDDDISVGSAHLLSKKMSISRLRKYLLVLLSIMIVNLTIFLLNFFFAFLVNFRLSLSSTYFSSACLV